jgi:hypothetical protein
MPVTFLANALAGAPVGILVESGDKQLGTAGTTLSQAIVLLVVDANGSRVSEAELELSPSAGFLADSTVRTDSVGRARLTWTMGRSAGSHTLAVHVEGVKKLLKLTAHARSAAPANLSFDDVVQKGKPSPSRPGTRTKRLYAVVTDLYGNPVEDAKVSFSTTSGTVAPKRAVSDARGRAEVTWKLSAKPGEQTLLGVVRATDVRGEYRVDVPGRASQPKTASVKPKGK